MLETFGLRCISFASTENQTKAKGNGNSGDQETHDKEQKTEVGYLGVIIVQRGKLDLESGSCSSLLSLSSFSLVSCEAFFIPCIPFPFTIPPVGGVQKIKVLG